MLAWENLSPDSRATLRAMCIQSFGAFLESFFQLLEGQLFRINWHHEYMTAAAERIYRRELTRLIVNVPPGSTKTEIWSIHFPAWAIMRCAMDGRRSRWLPISYSKDLVDENSARVKQIIESEPYQYFWPMQLSRLFSARNNWLFTDWRGNEHRMYGAPLGGQITGRRAGFMGKEFTGAVIVDDPQPPKDEAHPSVLRKANKWLGRVVRSRLADNDTPIVVIQQRVAVRDATDYLLGDSTPDRYEQIKIPARLDREYFDNLPANMRDAALADTGFTGVPVSYWEDKEPIDFLNKVESSDSFLFSSQYQQEPDEAFVEGVIFRREMDTLVEDGRLTKLPIEPALPVLTFWDIGYNDQMAIWLMQPHRMEIRLVGAYANSQLGIEHYINWLHDWRETHGIRFQAHYGPHDLGVHDVMTGRSRIDTARQMGLKFTLVPRPAAKSESINATRTLFPAFLIDPERCEDGWHALKHYRWKYDETNEVFLREPVHNWASNLADALQQIGLGWKKPHAKPAPEQRLRTVVGGERWLAS